MKIIKVHYLLTPIFLSKYNMIRHKNGYGEYVVKVVEYFNLKQGSGLQNLK